VTGGDLLYVSPVLPAPSGNGLAMRAHTVLRALALQFRVLPLVVPLWPGEERRSLIALDGVSVTARIVAFENEDEARLANAAAAYPGRDFDVVHVFRLSMLRFAEPYFSSVAGARPARHLDLDDVESLTRRRLAGLYRLHGRSEEAAYEEVEAARYQALEAEALRTCDRVYVCSEHDRSLLLPHSQAELVVLPNGARVPESLPLPPAALPFTFLFLGSLTYIANEDAVLFFCESVLPLLRAGARRPFRLVVAGTGLSEPLWRRLQLPNVEVIGDVPDVTPWYQQASAAVVPLRAGGGTRIKLLEAFAHRRPVVSTTVGVEGIEALDEEHLLVADAPDAFAERCLRLMTDAALCERLAANAFALLTRAYTVDRVAERLAASFAGAGGGSRTAPTARTGSHPAAAPHAPS
jgi:glycosyltransferase involved in cell wall biosynthesis